MNYQIEPWRWHLKKFARRAAVAADRAARLSGWRAAGPRLTVLTYHRFDGQAFDPVAVSRQAFEAQLRWLRAHVEVLDSTDFMRVLEGTKPLQRDAVLLTVDDGHRSFFQTAFPLLQRYRMPAILFVCPGLIEAGPDAAEFMSWAQLQEVQAQGLLIASHGHMHRSLTRIGPEAAADEITRAAAELKQRLGADNPFFSLPFGTRRDFSAGLADRLLADGYRYCFTSVHGPCRPLSRPNLFPRTKVEGGESLAMFRAIVAGGLDLWRVVDELAWPLQQRGRF